MKFSRNQNGKYKGIRCITSLNNKKDVDLVKLYVNEEIEIRHVNNLLTNNFVLSDKEFLCIIEKKKKEQSLLMLYIVMINYI